MEKILIIEDNKMVRESIADLLEMEGFNVNTACNGQEGIDMIKKNAPSLILCDVMMPFKNGLEVLQEIRSTATTTHIPFIFLSAKSQMTDLREGMNLGADDYLTKPVNAAELFEAIKTRLGKRKKLEGIITHQIKSNEPLGSRVFSKNLLSSIQYMVDEVSFAKTNLNDYTQDEFQTLINNVLAAGKNVKRAAYNAVEYQQLELAQYDAQIKKGFIHGTSSNLEPLLKQVAMEVAKKYDRAYDLYFKDVDETQIPIPINHFKPMVFEVIDNAFKFSNHKSLVTVEGKTIGNEYHLTIQDHGSGIDHQLLPILGKQPIINKKHFGVGLFLVSAILRLNASTLIINHNKETTGAKVKLKIRL